MRPARDGASGVLVVHPNLDLYGSDRVALDAVAALRSQGVATTLLLPGEGGIAAAARSVGVAVRTTRFPALRKSYLSPLGLLRLAAESAGALAGMWRVLRATRPAVVVVNTLTVPWWLALARAAGVPAVCHVHEAEEDLRPFVRRVLTAPLLLANGVVANSAATRRLSVASWPRLAGRTTVVHNAVTLPASIDVAVTPPGPLRLLLLGRLNPRKGQDLAVDALARLSSEGRDVHLTLAGSVYPGYEWYEEALRAQAERLGVAGRVGFAGFVDDPGPLYQAADIVVVPSAVESLGNVALEASAHGRPVVASRVGGLPEVVVDGETGLLVTTGDVTELVDAMRRLADRPDERAAYGAAGRRRVAACFSPAAFADGLRRALEAATGRPLT